MTRTPLAFALLTAAALSGCNKDDHTIVAGSTERNSPAVKPIDAGSLPPPIIASRIYRCKDNGLVYVDWLGDNVSANLRATETGSPTMLKAAEPGKPLTAEGYSLAGSATGSSITLTRPGKTSQSCKA